MLGATGGLALAQNPPIPPAPNPTQGQFIGPYGSGPAANNNNNAWGIANTPTGGVAAGPLSTIYAPNQVAVPTPGTVVVRINGRVEVDMLASWHSDMVGTTATGRPTGFKTNPLGIGTYFRLYPAFDGVSSNGLRYGASVEIRENFPAGGAPAASPSTYTSGQTLFVRRAFTYLASDKAGLLRLGQGDGVLGLFDNCIFTSQCYDAGIGNFNGGPLQTFPTSNATGIPFVWLAQAGAEYGNTKAVYLSPQYYGFDFGVQYAPSMGNANSACAGANASCVNLTSGNDPTRWYNQVAVGLRFQQSFGAVDFKAYGFYETAGKENQTAGTVPLTVRGAPLTFDNLSFYKGGVAITAMNFTLAGDYIGGAINNQLQMRPTGAPSMNAYLVGLTYANGPYAFGIEYGNIQHQGDVTLLNVSQRNEQQFGIGGRYAVAPGLALAAEYMYMFRHQGGFNFNSGTVGATSNGQGQGIVFSTILTW